jgi:hypothetical protein
MKKEELAININIDDKETNVKALISLVEGKDPIVAFVILDFGILRIKGCRVKWVDFNKDSHLSLIFDLPAYRTGAGFIKAVYFPDKRFYIQIGNEIVEKVQALLSNKDNNYDNNDEKNEEENFDEVPF